MITHDDLLQCFTTAFPPTAAGPQVRLLARYADPNLELPQGLAYVCIPDCHLLGPEDAVEFSKYVFTLDGDFEIFLKALAGFYATHRREMLVYQLGDLMDLWRTLGGRGNRVEANAIAAHYSRIVTLLRSQAPEGVNATVLAGNHDFALRDHGEWLAPRFLGIGGRRHPGGKGWILHGDQFDPIEALPDWIQEYVVKLVRSRKQGRKDLGALDAERVSKVNRKLARGDVDLFPEDLALPTQDAQQPPADRVNVIAPDAGGKAVKFYDRALAVANEAAQQGEDLRLIVIGHTHHARIVAGPRADGKPLVLMDCGAWVGTFQPPGSQSLQYKAQVGAIVGNDLRIYQVSGRTPH